jgi:hypothetical protein
LAMAVWRATQTQPSRSGSTPILGIARPGEWVEGTALVTRATRSRLRPRRVTRSAR